MSVPVFLPSVKLLDLFIRKYFIFFLKKRDVREKVVR